MRFSHLHECCTISGRPSDDDSGVGLRNQTLLRRWAVAFGGEVLNFAQQHGGTADRLTLAFARLGLTTTARRGQWCGHAGDVRRNFGGL